MMTPDGHYPTNFNVPRKMIDFTHMRASDLDRIMEAYELGPLRHRYYRGSLADRVSDDDFFRSSKIERRRNLITLFEFLGAHQVVEHLRCRARCGAVTHDSLQHH